MLLYFAMDGVISLRYLPSPSAEDTRIEILRRLADPNCLPFTMEQADAFEQGQLSSSRKDYWLGRRGFAVILIPPLFLATIALVPPSYYSGDGLSPREFVAVAVICTTLSIFISNISSMLFTGIFPDDTSSRENREQNTLTDLQLSMDDLAEYALLQYHTQGPENITRLTENFDKSRLITTVKEHTTQTSRVDDVFRKLSNVVTYIQSGGTNTSHDSWLETQIHLFLSIRAPFSREPLEK